MSDIDIIEQVNNFYNSAWDKLIIVGAIALGIVGVIAPAIIQWYQKRALKLSEENLREVLRREIENSKIQLKEEIETIVNKKTKKLKKTLKRKSKMLYNNSEGGLYYVQANGQLDGKEHYEAMRSYSTAINFYRKSKNFMSIKDILPNLIYCLDKIKKSDIHTLKENDDIDLDGILVKVLNKDKYGSVRNIILDDIYKKYDYFPKPKILPIQK